jgi:hypothetical protein
MIIFLKAHCAFRIGQTWVWNLTWLSVTCDYRLPYNLSEALPCSMK